MKKILIWFLKCIYKQSKKQVVRRIAIKAITTLEGGQYFSLTARELLRNYAHINIGIGTYGPCFDPANATPGVSIGKYCSIAPGASMYTRDHPYNHVSTCPLFYNASTGIIKEDTIPYGTLSIGNDVWIGRNATILPSCNKIGDGAVIGAGAIVTHDVPPYAIVVGVPAKITKFRFDQETINYLEESCWWDWDIREITSNTDIFSDIGSFMEYCDKRAIGYENKK